MSTHQQITLHVSGMDCANCAVGITHHLKKKGLQQVHTDFATGEVQFDLESSPLPVPQVISEINKLGYKVIEPAAAVKENKFLSSIEQRFYFSLFFTLPLLAHMFIPWALLHNAVFQLCICIPVFVLGVLHFGRSAWGSLRAGIPNMDVLVVIGFTAAFVYSLIGTILFFETETVHHYLFFETTASIISFVLLGNLIEHRAVKQTTSAIRDLASLTPETATKIKLKNGVNVFETIATANIVRNDVLLVNTGQKIPADGTITEGWAVINEAVISGESIPVTKQKGDRVIAGTILEQGSIQVQVSATGNQTVLAQIIEMVKKAQQAKPSIQKLGDKVSAVFVPVVLAISLVTFAATWFVQGNLQEAVMNSIAVLVISCPCAMGLATPTAVMVGIGRAAKNGILIKGGNTLELFAKSKTIVFDKTGTLTTGKFKIQKFDVLNPNYNIATVRNIVYTIEMHSGHPIARSIVEEWKNAAAPVQLENINEVKGTGMQAIYKGDRYFLGTARHLNSTVFPYDIVLSKNDEVIAGINVMDEILPGIEKMILRLHSLGLHSVLLSGDKMEKCRQVADLTGIQEVYGEKLPEEKLKIIGDLGKKGCIAMVGDGVNDAPALTKADVGISMSQATDAAMNAAQIILLNRQELSLLIKAFQLSKMTLTTIKQNLFWAFFYNSLAIPLAAFGYLSPMIGALSMAFSDVIVIGNSILLKFKRLR